MRTELIQASELLRRNTPEAIEEAIGLLQNTVFSFSMKMCGHRQDAEDTAQEVLFRSLKHLSKLEDAHALAAWLYTVTKNRCHRMRRGPLQRNETKLSLDELIPDDDELRRLLLAAESGPEHDAIRAEQRQLLHQAVLRLPVPLRMVLVLHDMEELESEQIAQILDVQVGTVRVRLHRARLAVRKHMADLLAGMPEKNIVVKPAVTDRPAECRELFANLSEYLDARVEPRTCEQMRAHIEGCPACIAFINDLRAAIDRCRSMEVACDADVAARMRSLMTKEYLRLLSIPAVVASSRPAVRARKAGI
ncbi:sigma-70 family RNA polymerase sigma factor [Occallatibacter riparius]|uniref:Sigma-70 family RNA polymerase sigma factor n=1 Tax=Occallatibacter riparius TaxID=1002689 RepID=A0A9J7BK34_9BACT|nr:sigma-70 family RNA polymerase sigma factor [Occallatibacter riparius]UWZ83192.1 sigma-70 family RNA polymerase sigma factor [Occallatibacter riparius]